MNLLQLSMCAPSLLLAVLKRDKSRRGSTRIPFEIRPSNDLQQ
jgi:hypothetical protein